MVFTSTGRTFQVSMLGNSWYVVCISGMTFFLPCALQLQLTRFYLPLPVYFISHLSYLISASCFLLCNSEGQASYLKHKLSIFSVCVRRLASPSTCIRDIELHTLVGRYCSGLLVCLVPSLISTDRRLQQNTLDSSSVTLPHKKAPKAAALRPLAGRQLSPLPS